MNEMRVLQEVIRVHLCPPEDVMRPSQPDCDGVSVLALGGATPPRTLRLWVQPVVQISQESTLGEVVVALLAQAEEQRKELLTVVQKQWEEVCGRILSLTHTHMPAAVETHHQHLKGVVLSPMPSPHTTATCVLFHLAQRRTLTPHNMPAHQQEITHTHIYIHIHIYDRVLCHTL